MSLNRNDVMCKIFIFHFKLYLVDKSKLIVIKLNRLYLVIPLTITKVEVRIRNVIINERNKFDGLSRFMEFYINNCSDS